MKEAKLIMCGNDFYTKHFNEVCEALEQGEAVRVGIDCIGHTRNNSVQEDYKRALTDKYGERLTTTVREGCCRYSYIYSLAKAE